MVEESPVKMAPKSLPYSEQTDPLKKREEFAISLRRQKKDQIIKTKRKRLLDVKKRSLEVDDQSQNLAQLAKAQHLLQSMLNPAEAELTAEQKTKAIIMKLRCLLDGSQNEEDTKDVLERATNFLYMLCEWDWHEEELNLRVWVRQIGLIEFVMQLLHFCRSRTDTYSELAKDMVVKLLKKLSLEEDDGQICAELCKPDSCLLELLGAYMYDESQSEPVKREIFTTFTNICSETNENLKEAVIKRGKLLDFLSGPLCTDTFLRDVPWLVFNLYIQQVSLLLQSEHIFETCMGLLGRSLKLILSNGEHEQQSLHYTQRVIESLLLSEGSERRNPETNRDAIMKHLEPIMQQLFTLTVFDQTVNTKFGTPAKKIGLDLTKSYLRILGLFYAGSFEQSVNFSMLVPDVEARLYTTFILPFIQMLSKKTAHQQQNSTEIKLQGMLSDLQDESFTHMLGLLAHQKHNQIFDAPNAENFANLELIITGTMTQVLVSLSNMYADSALFEDCLTHAKVTQLLELADTITIQLRPENCHKLMEEVAYTLSNLIGESPLECVRSVFLHGDPTGDLFAMKEVIAFSVKFIESVRTKQSLMHCIFDMLSALVSTCGYQARECFEEHGGQDLLENLEQSPSQKVRRLASDFLSKFFGGSQESDFLFQQQYHQSEALPAKTDEDRYFNDDAEGGDCGDFQHYYSGAEGDSPLKEDNAAMTMDFYI